MTGRILRRILGGIIVVVSLVANGVVVVMVVRHPQLLAELQQPAAPTTTNATIVSYVGNSLTVKNAAGQQETVTLASDTPIGFASTNPEVPAALQIPMPATSSDLVAGAAVVLTKAPTLTEHVTSVLLPTDHIIVGRITNITSSHMTLVENPDPKAKSDALTLSFGTSVQTADLVDLSAPSAQTKSIPQSELANDAVVLVRTDQSPADPAAAVLAVLRLPLQQPAAH